MFREIIKKNRSYRRFYQNQPITRETLEGLVDLARLSPSSVNKQPLKFMIVNKPEENKKVFENLAWAGNIKDWPGPVDGEQPSAYIIILGDKNISNSYGVDPGIYAQSIMLGAVEKGFGGCMLGSINRNNVAKHFNISEQYEIILVLALGVPKETVIIDDMEKDGCTKYWRETDGTHHVPKRKLENLILN